MSQSDVHPTRSTSLVRRIAGLAYRITTPLYPDDYLDLINPLWSYSTLRGRVEAVRRETADATTLIVRPGHGWVPHLPGQYVRVGIDIDGVRRWRCYSFTSAPAQSNDLISLTVKAMKDGLVSNRLVHDVGPGDYLHLGLPEGEFVLPAEVPAKVLFLTAGSGITPIMSMLRGHDLHDAVVLHSSPTPSDVIFGSALRRMHAFGRIRLIEWHTDRDGLIDLAKLDAIVADWRERETWACGPVGLMAAAEEHWSANRAGSQLHIERFRPHIAVQPGAGGAVTFTTSGVVKDFRGDEPILTQAEHAGVVMPYGCRMGVCHRCVLPLRSGAVRDLRDGTVTTAAPGDGVVIQTCVNAVAGPCEIEN